MSTYRSTYTPWGKTLTPSYTGKSSSTSSAGSSSSAMTINKSTDSGSSSQYDGYGRRFSSGTTGSAGSYRSTSSYRSPYTSTSTTTGSRERSSSRGGDLTSSLIDRFSTNKDSGERLSLRDKYNYSTYPGRSETAARTTYGKIGDEEDKKDKDTTNYTRTLGRSTSAKGRDLSPEPPPDKCVYGSGSGGSLSSYRLYGSRSSSYSRSNSRDAGESASSSSSTPATTPVQIPTSLRFGSSTRYGVSVPRSPVSEKPPTVFGIASDRYSRYSRKPSAEEKKEPVPPETATSKASEVNEKKTEEITTTATSSEETSEEEEEEETEEKPPTIFITVVTRGTSPTPPSTSTYVRTRRADLARVIEKTVSKPTKKPPMVDKEIQSDRGDDTARLSRFGGSSRTSPWSSYLDRYGAGGYSSRYSSRLDRYGGYGSSSTKSSEKDTSSTAPATSTVIETNQKSNSTSVPSSTIGKGTPELKHSATVTKTDVPKDSSLPNKSSPNFALKNKEVSTKESPSTTSTVLPVTKNVTKTEKEFKSVKDRSSNEEASPKMEVVPKTESSLPPSSLSVSRTGSSKSVTGKPPIKTDSTPQTESSSSLKSKSSSSSSLSEAPVTKTPPHSPPVSKSTTKQESADAVTRKLKLPPPVPKGDGSQLKSSSSLHSLNKSSAANKDFRKSALNVELPNSAEVEAFQKLQEKQRKAGKFEKKTKRSSSISSGDSEPSAEQGNVSSSSLPTTIDKESITLRVSKSLSKLATNGPVPNFLEIPKPKTKAGSPKRQSPARSKSGSKSGRSPSHSPSQRRRRSATYSTSSDSSSSESSDSSSSSESSSDENENQRNSRSSPSKSRRSNRSPSISEKRKSVTSLTSARSSTDDITITADKPPRPPASPKNPPKAEEPKSFLMRALAPVTNLFKMKQEPEVPESKSNENIPAALPRTGSNQSLSKTSDKEENKSSDVEKPKKHKIKHIESGERAWWLDNSDNVPEGILKIKSNKSIAKLAEAVAELQKPDSKSKLKYKITKQESGERAWWLDSNANIPEGIQKIMSNSNLNEKTDSGIDNKVSSNLKKIKSSRSISKVQDNANDAKERSQLYKIRHQQSGEKAWWLCSSGNIPEGVIRLETSSSDEDSSLSESEKGVKSQNGTKSPEDNSSVPKFPLVIPEPSSSRKGSTTSLKDTVVQDSHSNKETGRQSPYDNVKEQHAAAKEVKKEKTATKNQHKPRPKHLPLFISRHTNIDDILGTAATMVEPAMGVAKLKKKLESKGAQSSEDEDLDDDDSACEEVDATQVRIHDSTAKKPNIQHVGNVAGEAKKRRSLGMIKLDDTALQLYKDGDYGSYLDLEASISEQHEEFDGFQDNRKNSIVLRTQLSVRVHTIIEKLLNSEGRELRRALFSLKQIFQEDKDLVHEFVQNDGLACLIKVGSEADQNYQNYILRALGQVMLYVDGMNGVMEHNQTVQWLYALIASKYRLVVKTALKLLLVFVEYVETNCLLLIKAVHAVDSSHGLLPWSNIMKLLKDYDAADTELLIYATTLINKTLNGIPDQDTYYDQVDALEEQGIESAIQRYMSKQGTDLDLLRQLQIYEAVLHHEDGEEKGTPLKQLDENIRKTLRNRKSLNESMTTERRKSRRHSTGTSPLSTSLTNSKLNNTSLHTSTLADDEETESSSSRSSPVPGEVHLNGTHKDGKGDVGVTPALRRRRERAERQRSFIREQQETAANLKANLTNTEDSIEDENQKHANSLSQRIGNGSLEGGDMKTSNKLQLNRVASRKDLTPLLNAVNSAESENKMVDSNGILKKPWVLSMMYGKNADGSENIEVEDIKPGIENGTDESSERKKLLQLKRENTVKDLTQKLSNQSILHSPVDEGNNKINRIGDMTGLISKAKEGLAKSKSKADVMKSPTGENVPKVAEVKKSETELHWEELVQAMKRPLSLCDLDFTDLKSEDEVDILSPANVSNGGPPPPPPVPMTPGTPRLGNAAPPPPPPASKYGNTAPPPFPPTNNGPPVFGVNLRNFRNNSGTASTVESSANKTPTSPVKKTKKTVKLFWKEVRDDPIILAKLQKTGMIWDELNPVMVDTQKLEHLFESRAKDLITKKQQEMNKNKEIIVLDHKRSNAINIGMTKLPPPRSIKTAILKMDATIMNREGIEKLLTMLPTEEERSKIQEAQMANPDLPLGSAEQFLLTLASISELPARLKLWAFKLDYENSEKEIAEPLMDLKQGMETLKINKTFRGILSTLLSIGIFLNGNEVKGFQIEYLAKVPEVKDTVHKHSLLHHLCHMVMEKFPDSSDLYSEIGAITRASKVDFDELSANILRMEQECKASWDHLKVIAKHDGSTMMKVKMSDFLADCAERIIVLGIVHRRVMNRFHKFLLWLGIPLHRVQDMKPNEFCRIVSEFALEYRTTRERVLQQLEKKANHRERNKTRGKMITEVGKFRTKEDRADAELRQLLGSDISDAESIHGSLPWRRQRKDIGRTSLGPLIKDETVNGNLTDGDDEILESLVKTATKAPTTRTTPRERKRTRHADRKSLRRTLKNGLSEEDKKHLAAYIKGY